MQVLRLFVVGTLFLTVAGCGGDDGRKSELEAKSLANEISYDEEFGLPVPSAAVRDGKVAAQIYYKLETTPDMVDAWFQRNVVGKTLGKWVHCFNDVNTNPNGNQQFLYVLRADDETGRGLYEVRTASDHTRMVVTHSKTLGDPDNCAADLISSQDLRDAAGN